jgi:hypothetical protein
MLAPEGAPETVPTFVWERVEGAAGYTIQIDNDANFSSPLINQKLDSTSYTPKTALPDGDYYWRVAMRRSKTVIGQWTPTFSFVKRSLSPTPFEPINGVIINQQPTFRWSVVLTPTETPRMAAPRYRLQVDSDPNFSRPTTYETQATSYTLIKGKSLSDGAWYWRVAVIDAANQVGAYSPVQQFYKEYLPPTLLQPQQGSSLTGVPSFEWASLSGAAYYKIQIDDEPLFNLPTSVTTDNSRYTPTQKMASGKEFYWRVQMYDADRELGPFEIGQVAIQQNLVYLPLISK